MGTRATTGLSLIHLCRVKSGCGTLLPPRLPTFRVLVRRCIQTTQRSFHQMAFLHILNSDAITATDIRKPGSTYSVSYMHDQMITKQYGLLSNLGLIHDYRDPEIGFRYPLLLTMKECMQRLDTVSHSTTVS
jgi:hypothetical protein